ncbi:MAG TPA: sigma-70 family RNA polymerase sigma factor [Pirellulaceae bacterium]|nr:sigma-70 family RNA polymerase sigma factor [Pirellulaceae bacterium]
MSEEVQLWRQIENGSTSAFEEVVHRYQGAVSGVAFNLIGDFSASQDVAQETFWTAWRSRHQLRDPENIAAWLCGIARNLSRQWLRQRPVSQYTLTEASADVVNRGKSPLEEMISREEQGLVWESLSKLPEHYREVLVLYYRQGQSIAEVAQTLELSEDAVKQRLHRGREMIRNELAEVIEGVLARSRPGRAFTAHVMAGLAGAASWGASGTGGAPAGAATAAISSAIKAGTLGGAGGGIAGGALGAVGGLAGSWLGTWLPAQLAATETERQFLQRKGRRLFVFSIVFTIALAAWCCLPLVLPIGKVAFLMGFIMMGLVFTGVVLAIVLRTQREWRQIQSQLHASEDPNRSPWKAQLGPWFGHGPEWRPISFRSRWTLFGWPLFSVSIGTPDSSQPSRVQVAQGWVAIGDRADGLLFAAGGLARGLIAIGGLAIGGIAIGGLAMGGIALGGGALAFLAMGGLAMGWDAVGGLAIGWNSAVGGLAIALHVAHGGLAIARDFATGGDGWGREFNTPAADNMVQTWSLLRFVNWLNANMIAVSVVILLFVAGCGTLFVAATRVCRKK